MAEDQERIKQYTYGANSNLVIQRDRAHRETGPSGEVETLSDTKAHDLRSKMGNRAKSAKPKDFIEKIDKLRKRKSKRDNEEGNMRKKRHIQSSFDDVLDSDINTFYKPKTLETQRSYTVLLNLVMKELGDRPRDQLQDFADAALSILKDDEKIAVTQKKEIDELFHGKRKKMKDASFTAFINTARSITDYSREEEGDNKLAEEGVPINFDASDEEDEGAVVREEDEDERDDEDMEAQRKEKISSILGEDGRRRDENRGKSSRMTLTTARELDEGPLDDQKAEIDVKEIKGFWLQEQLRKYFPEATECQKKAVAVLETLENVPDVRECENILVNDLLGFPAFRFIGLLLRNRWEVVYCTKLDRCTEEEKKKLEHKMMDDPKLKPIVEALHTRTGNMQDRVKAYQRDLRRQAGEIKQKQASRVRETTEKRIAYSDESEYSKKKMLIELDSIAFKKEGHFMSNTKWKLPPKSWHASRKGYTEIFIPHLKKKKMERGDTMSVSKLPQWARKAFDGAHLEEKRDHIEYLNPVQTKCFSIAFESAENVLLCAPTGAGKTNVALLTILREIGLHRDQDGNIDLDSFKIVYVAPMKSLVREMVMSFTKRLTKPYGVVVKELSGDQQLSIQQISETQIIVTTPEKWDIITRKSGDRTYTQMVKLVIIDEIHLLHDIRGPVLESIISRTIRQVETSQEVTRMVGLSATLPNYEDVATFLRVNPSKGLFFFDAKFRPCPLQQVFIGITISRPFKQHLLSNQITYEKTLEQCKDKNQVLIFVHSRKETALTATFLRDTAEENGDALKFMDEGASREILKEECENVRSDSLRDLLPYGFAIHHAGMKKEDRTLVEDLFEFGHVKVLVSTATLAWGVNLPAHCVIIKGTQVYSPEKGRWVELSMLDVMQMTGRAGRPGKDTKGQAYIITTQKELKYYMSLLNEQLPIESQLVSKLADNLNAEIVLGTVRNMQEAVNWMYYTYLYVRMLAEPELYGVAMADLASDTNLVQRRYDLIHSASAILDKSFLIKYDRKGGTFQSTDLGRVASHYYITHDTMQVFNNYMKPIMSDIEILRIFSLAEEFKNISVRDEEEKELSRLVDKVPIPVKEDCKEPSAKVNVLLQAYISRLKLEGYALIADMQYVTQSAGRLMRALFTIALKRGWSSTAQKCLALCKMIDHRMWGIQSPLRQFRGKIAPDVIRTIERREFPWQRFFDLKANEIGELVRIPEQGHLVHKYVHSIPVLDLQGHVQPITRSILRVELSLTADFKFHEDFHHDSEPFWIFVEDVDGETILHHEYFLLKSQFSKESHSVSFTIPIYDPLPPQYFIRVISDRWLGSESVLPISFRNLILPEKYPPPTELLDLQPLPVKCFEADEYISLYEGQFECFNPIQTQVFNVMYKSDDNVLLAAPTGSGKTICAEFAVLRMLENFPKGRCVYVAPMGALADERYADWQKKFGFSGLKVNVVKLTGDMAADMKLLQAGQIIISTAERWDMMSRRWKTRKNVQNINLVILDELHLIGGELGPTLEVVGSRMRYIAGQTNNPIRMIGLSTSVANANDLGYWLGAPNTAIFHFTPGSGVRPVRLDIFIQGFDINHFESRQLAMVKPAYLSITHRSPNRPVIVFVPTRKIARRVAVDFMNFALAEEKPERFIKVTEKDLAPYLKPCSKNRALQETLKKGIGFYHKRMTIAEKSAVGKLFDAGAIQILVAEHDTCWGMTFSAHMVVIMGTKYYDGGQHRYVDYPITDIIQMMGRASRPKVDQTAKCVVYCHAPRKDFYKKFLYEPFPVESHLDHYLGDHLLAEIVTKTLENYQDTVDYLTWTFLYRRFTQNPNYYNLTGSSHRHLSDHLSEVVEDTLDELERAKCISVEATDVSPLNLGMIAAYYYVNFSTLEMYARDLKATRKLAQLMDTLCTSTEFMKVPVRRHEDAALKSLANHMVLPIRNPDWNSPATKAHVLLQCHFKRLPLSADVRGDRDEILKYSLRLLQAMVDVISSNGWLKPALAAMELSQMITQGLWDSDSPLMQLPHVTKDIATKLIKKGVKNVFDVSDVELSDLRKTTGLQDNQMMDIIRVVNQYPDVDVSFEVKDESNLVVGKSITVLATIERDDEDEENTQMEGDEFVVPKVFCPRYPGEKTEAWWVVIGDPETNSLWTIKRIAMKKRSLDLRLVVPTSQLSPGKYRWMLYLMSDSYLGCDQEYPIRVTLKPKSRSDSESDSDMSDDE